MALRTLLTRKTLAEGLGLGFGGLLQRRKPRVVMTMMQSSHGLKTVTLPKLSYEYGALEPVISGEIMELHHKKHHQTYVTNYNKALEQLRIAMDKGDTSSVVKLQSAIKFNGGGHINHSIFWKNLSPIGASLAVIFGTVLLLVDFLMPHTCPINILVLLQMRGGEPPKGALGRAIDTHFGSFDNLVLMMNAEGVALQGSGWVWLGLEVELEKLVIETTDNQDPLVTKGPLVPLLGIDVWEHAYYLQYKNERLNYLINIWKVINWKDASRVYDKECP